MTEAEVHVWRLSLDDPQWELGDLEALLSDDERTRCSHFGLEDLRRRFIVRRGLLRSILASYRQVEPRKLRFEYGSQGKPRIVGELALESLQFNAAHSHGMALIAVALRRDVGIDLEKIREEVEHDEIAARYFAPSERAFLARQPPESRLAFFFDLWTYKEAFIKLRGGGLSIPLNGFEVQFVPGESIARIADLGAPPSDSAWYVQKLEAAPGVAAALALDGLVPRITMSDWEP
ncbi:MAG: 4'-phosphopantetheinyl transferase superfamily protein [Thermoanaerobaculia bacterium]